MTIEELTKVISSEGVDRVNAALQSLGYRAFKLEPSTVAPDAALCSGTLQILDVSGKSIPGHEITIEPVLNTHSIDVNGSTAYSNLVSKAYTVISDENGLISTSLVKGSTIRIYVDKSSVFREIIVPTTDFNLLDPSISTEPDGFSSPSIAPVLTIRGDI